ncbi:MAG: hypothetical protein A2915_04200 [Candidatus Yanofskybacteria bacterium RIFCSPLOWO2_01_FULL_41_34]|uniref:histidine kinase n=1 Tax=Candidatus Yanofskybacteria bacterium RIFCSPHIGHO2_01_FULL_41_26 TaxID=1802661 RepID=A0A1F8ED93_9BACT|nr:MAG: hypothetical protein A2649_03300 [Candidatus Yanofskybacteria bacterium RIFCSPHIGHO2_01_FULL_41_26]OGN21609.1 MAG: hypothetical protein A2915_04200 [Candidatus Yanofskybacteria bacterium RIFCSPLOWO2_01_FULL_41_34]
MENERKFTPKQDGIPRPIIEVCSKINEFLRSQIIPQFAEKQARAKFFCDELTTKIHGGQKITREDLDAFKKIQDSIIVELIGIVHRMQDNFFTEGDFLLNSLVGTYVHDIKGLISSRFEEYADKLKDYLDLQENEQAIENVPVFNAFTISDIEINPENFTPREDDLSEVFNDLNYQYKHGSEQRPNIILEVERPSEKIEIDHFLGLTIESINELIRNAIDAMPNGGTIKISAEKHGDNVAITITDTGAGITEENLQKIFEDGFTTKTQGTGKGLFLLKEYFEKVLNGKVDIISEVGKGTTISITLPVLKKEH